MKKINGHGADQGTADGADPTQKPGDDDGTPAFPNFERMRKSIRDAPQVVPTAPGSDIIGPFRRIPAEDSVHPPMTAARRPPAIPTEEALNDSGSNKPAAPRPYTAR